MVGIITTKRNLRQFSDLNDFHQQIVPKYRKKISDIEICDRSFQIVMINHGIFLWLEG